MDGYKTVLSFDVRYSIFDVRTSTNENRPTKIDQRKSNIENRTSDNENRTSKTENRISNIENRTSNNQHRSSKKGISSLLRQGEDPIGFSYWCNKAKAETYGLGFSGFIHSGMIETNSQSVLWFFFGS